MDVKKNILALTNENNTLYNYDDYRDINIYIKIGLKLDGLSSSDEAKKKMENQKGMLLQ